MNKSKSIWWKCVYNSLYLLTIHKDELAELKKIPFPLFDTFEEELEEAIDVGFCDDAVEVFLLWNWIDKSQADEFKAFQNHIYTIESKFWKENLIIESSEWEIARKWASKLFGELGFTRNGFDASGIEVLWTNE